MKQTKYEGLIAASFTPFKKDGALDLEKIPGLVDFSIMNGLAGLFTCGSTGEFASMSTQERMDTAKAYLEAAAGRIPVIVHVGSCSINESKQLAQHAVKYGASGFAALAPFYFQVKTIPKLVECMSHIAEAAPELPFYYYHLPCATGADVDMSEFVPVAEKAIPNFAGVKFTHENLMDYQRAAGYTGGRLQIMFGRDEILLSALSLGAEAAVGSTFNYGSWIYHNVIAAYSAGDMKTAQYWQSISQQLVGLLQKFGPGAHKALMRLAGADAGHSRLPLPDLSQSELQEFIPEAEAIFELRNK